MIWRLLKATLVSVFVLCTIGANADAPKAWGYLGWWLPENWRSVPLGELDRLLFFEIKVAPTGFIADRHGWPEAWTELRHAVEQNNTPLDLTLTLDKEADFETLFSSDESAQRLFLEAESLAAQSGVAGLQLDFEVYKLTPPESIERYRAFVRQLAVRLHEQVPRRSLSVFLPIGGASALYDAASLAQIDHVVLQGYDAHWLDGSTAGPVAPLAGSEAVTWEKALATGLALGVPVQRLFLSFPLYGYEWPVKTAQLRAETLGKGRITSFAPILPIAPFDVSIDVQSRVRQYGATHDPLSGSSYYQFSGPDGKFVEGWFEDWWSLSRKTDFLVDRRLGGIAFFLLGYDDGQLVRYFSQRRGRRSLQDFVERFTTSGDPRSIETQNILPVRP